MPFGPYWPKAKRLVGSKAALRWPRGSLCLSHTHTHTHTHRLRLRATRSTTLPGEVTSDQATNIGNVTSVAISLDGMREIAIWSSFEIANWFDALYHASQLSRCGGP